MNVFANLPASERHVVFEQTAAKMGLPAHLIEKDFWVCFTLGVLFSIDDFAQHLTFKGGTSLSKVYKAIERFSEDIDFAINRDCLGFGGDNAPDARGISGVQREKRLESLSQACEAKVTDELQPLFKQELEKVLTGEWSLNFNPNEKYNQVFNFSYPRTDATVEDAYNPSDVRVELTARTDNHPSESAIVSPYIIDQFPDAIDQPEVVVNVLKVERTFWEKATILHQFHFQEDPDRVTEGFSRHYYDVNQLDLLRFSDSALEQIELLPEVADHKKVFYRQGWARYDLAREPATLELIPHDNILATIKRDYAAMQEMMFGESPSFDEIIARLNELKQRINEIKQ